MNKKMASYRIFLCLLLIFVSSLPLAAEKPEEWDGINYLERTLSYTESSDLSLIPDFERTREIRDYVKEFDPSGSVELLYRMPLPSYSGEDLMLYILNRISRISTMEGLEYFSGSRQRMYPYLEKAFVVEKKGREEAVEDPQFSRLPGKPESFTVYQRDTTFGDTWYDVTMEYTGSAIRLSMVNVTTMRYKLFPVLRKERLHIEMIIIPREEDLIFYGLASFKLGNTFGIEIDLDESFDHRMSALQVWFNNQVY